MKPVYVVIIAALAGTTGFFTGMKYSQSKIADGRQNISRQFGQGTNAQLGGRRFNARPISGEIVSIDDKSITVKMQDGQSKIVLISESTQINQATQASKTDLKQGTTVAVFGSENSDGSVTAQNIQLNPQFRR